LVPIIVDIIYSDAERNSEILQKHSVMRYYIVQCHVFRIAFISYLVRCVEDALYVRLQRRKNRTETKLAVCSSHINKRAKTSLGRADLKIWKVRICVCADLLKSIARTQLLRLSCDFRISLFFLASLFSCSLLFLFFCFVCVCVCVCVCARARAYMRENLHCTELKRIACSYCISPAIVDHWINVFF